MNPFHQCSRSGPLVWVHKRTTLTGYARWGAQQWPAKELEFLVVHFICGTCVVDVPVADAARRRVIVRSEAFIQVPDSSIRPCCIHRREHQLRCRSKIYLAKSRGAWSTGSSSSSAHANMCLTTGASAREARRDFLEWEASKSRMVSWTPHLGGLPPLMCFRREASATVSRWYVCPGRFPFWFFFVLFLGGSFTSCLSGIFLSFSVAPSSRWRSSVDVVAIIQILFSWDSGTRCGRRRWHSCFSVYASNHDCSSASLQTSPWRVRSRHGARLCAPPAERAQEERSNSGPVKVQDLFSKTYSLKNDFTDANDSSIDEWAQKWCLITDKMHSTHWTRKNSLTWRAAQR